MAAPTVIPSDGPARSEPSWRGMPSAVRCLLALAGGLTLFASVPPRGLWWLAPLAFALLGPALHGRRARAGFGYGYLFGVAFYLPLLPWIGEFVGALPWLALSCFVALTPALAGAGMALASRLPAAPLWAACVWVAAEALLARVPWGGFPWGRVAFSQPEGPFLPVAALGGTPLLGAVVVLCGLSVGELARRALRHGSARPLVAPAVLALLPLLLGFAATPTVGTGAQDGSVTVALIQGNVPRAGLDFNAQRRAVLDNHAERTEQLASGAAAGRRPQPDLVIWPENSSDIDPLRNPDAQAVIDRAAGAIGVPILVGAVLQPDTGRPTNTMIVWDPGTGPGEEHDKRRLQPFGEYLPGREFFRLFSRYADAAGNFVDGDGDGAVDLGPARVGIATCYEVIFDDLVRQSVRSGAQVLAVPTNNATFGYTEMTYQQQAMSRVRAVEHGRAVLIAATSGISAVIRPDGSVAQRSSLFTPAALVSEVPLRSGITVATRLGAGPEWVLAALGVAGALAGALRQRGAGSPV
ncbi:MAG: apolipoprotein N-acyltransferase [Pseudonocardiaceae bacterium]